MTREEAINVLKTDSCYECSWGCDSPGSCHCGGCDLAEATRIAIESLEVFEWVPVTERLPKITEHHVSEVVICYLSNGAYCFGSLEENPFGQTRWSCERDDEYHQPVGKVLAWMPLPEPYMAESEDKE